MDVNLPSSFKHIKIQQNTYRCNIINENDVKKWIEDYSKETKSRWIVKFRVAAPSRFLFREKFACHHTSHRRITAEENKRGNSKNTDCKAEIEIKIKLVTKNTKKRDKFIKEGMPAVLIFKENHNHSQNTLEALSFLKPTEGTREIFEAYFNEGLSITESIRLHESKLEIDFSESVSNFNSRIKADVANSFIIPKYRTVHHWYTVWLSKNLDRFEDGMIDKVKEEMEAHQTL